MIKEIIIKFLKKIDLYDYLMIFKDIYFKNPSEKFNEGKRIKLYSGFINEGDLCFDIGANYGNRTYAFLKIGAKVVAVEPQIMLAKYLRRKFKNEIVIVTQALGSNNGYRKMYLSDANTLSSLSEEWVSKVKNNRFKGIQWDGETNVEVTTLDDLISKYGKPKFCKIDVEGYELEVLKGLSSPIDVLSFEYTIPEFTMKAIQCIQYLNSLGSIVCNYSPGESMELCLKDWLSPEDFIPIFDKLYERKIIDGDIYVKFLNVKL
jgi:FkbM family methyltransferase